MARRACSRAADGFFVHRSPAPLNRPIWRRPAGATAGWSPWTCRWPSWCKSWPATARLSGLRARSGPPAGVWRFTLDNTDRALAALAASFAVRVHYRTRYWGAGGGCVKGPRAEGLRPEPNAPCHRPARLKTIKLIAARALPISARRLNGLSIGHTLPEFFRKFVTTFA